MSLKPQTRVWLCLALEDTRDHSNLRLESQMKFSEFFKMKDQQVLGKTVNKHQTKDPMKPIWARGRITKSIFAQSQTQKDS